MNLVKRKNELSSALAEQREIQRQAQLALENARAAEHQLLGAIAMIDEMLARQDDAPQKKDTDAGE